MKKYVLQHVLHLWAPKSMAVSVKAIRVIKPIREFKEFRAIGPKFLKFPDSSDLKSEAYAFAFDSQ